MSQRKALVDAAHRLSIRRQADLLAVNRRRPLLYPCWRAYAEPAPDAGNGSVIYRRPDTGSARHAG